MARHALENTYATQCPLKPHYENVLKNSSSKCNIFPNINRISFIYLHRIEMSQDLRLNLLHNFHVPSNTYN